MKAHVIKTQVNTLQVLAWKLEVVFPMAIIHAWDGGLIKTQKNYIISLRLLKNNIHEDPRSRYGFLKCVFANT